MANTDNNSNEPSFTLGPGDIRTLMTTLFLNESLVDGYYRKGIAVSQSRIFSTREDAEKSIHPNINAPVSPRPGRRIIDQEGNMFLYSDAEDW